MNQADKVLLVSKGFINDKEQVNDVEIQMSALMEATVFAGAIMDSYLDFTKLIAVSLYIEELAGRKDYLHMHLYVQKCFKECRTRGELDIVIRFSLMYTVQEIIHLVFWIKQ